MIAPWPEYREDLHFADAESAVGCMQEVVRGIRNTRTQMQVPQGRKTHVYIVAGTPKDAELYRSCAASFINLSSASALYVQENKEGIGSDAVSIVVSNAVAYLPLEDLVDKAKELERLTKEKERLAKEILRCEGMLNNPNFVNKAPAAKVDAEKEKLAKYKEMADKVETQLKMLA